MKKILIASLGIVFAYLAFAAADYVVIAPKNYVELWTWYIGERQKAHPNVTFAVKSAEEIYATYQYGEGKDYRNAAESIKAYINAATQTGTKYFVLGGMWFDVQATAATVQGVTLTVDNAIPGITAYPVKAKSSAKYFDQYPSDLYFACPANWDPNSDGEYCGVGELSTKDSLMPKCIVSRMDFRPSEYVQKSDGSIPTYEELVRAYVNKLVRGESASFDGNNRFAGLSGQAKMTGSMYDKDGNPDTYYTMNLRLNTAIKAARPSSITYLANLKKDYKEDDTIPMKECILGEDWEMFMPYDHGTLEGISFLSTGFFGNNVGLIKFFACNAPCFGGSVNNFDYSSVAETAISNPNGGALVAIGNASYGQSAETSFAKRYCGISDEMLDYTLDAYVRDGKTAGEAWKYAISTYVGIIYGANQQAEIEKRGCNVEEDLPYIQSAIVEEMLFGDPLIQLGKSRKAPVITVK